MLPRAFYYRRKHQADSALQYRAAENYGPCLDFVCAGSMSFQGGLIDQMEAAQREFLDAQRRWNADEKGDLKLLEICSDAEQRLVAAFFVGWIADMRPREPRYSHFRNALVQYNGGESERSQNANW